MSDDRRRIAIVGGGFGGLAVAQALRKVDVDVTLIDRTNHHLFQPLLYQLAASALSMGDCAAPFRGMLRRQRNVQVVMAGVTEVDPERRELTLDRGERIGYDSLIVACGATTSYFGHDEWAEPSFSLKTLADAVALRDHILSCFEEAERTSDPDAQRRLQTFVVIGGGPTGIEMAGQLAVLARHHMKGQFTRFDPAATRIVVLDAGERILAAFSPKLSAKAAHELGELGVEVIEGSLATAIDADGVSFERDGKSERIEANTVVWAAGVQTAPFARTLADATGAAHDRGGRLEVAPDCSLPGHPESRDRRRGGASGTGRQAAARTRDRRDPAGAPRGEGGRERLTRCDRAVPLLRQGRAGRDRTRARDLCGQRHRAVRPARVLYLPRRSPVLPRRRAWPADQSAEQMGLHRLRARTRPDHRARTPASTHPGMSPA